MAAFAAADVFCLPTHLDNQPVVLFEAMAAGLPVVTTTVGAIPETLVSEEHGLLTAPRDRDQLGQALIQLLRDPPLRARMGALGRERVTREFDRRVVIHRLIGELESVHRRRSGEAAMEMAS
jgi:glycosyltransferase involved in cell wall biosynthesis